MKATLSLPRLNCVLHCLSALTWYLVVSWWNIKHTFMKWICSVNETHQGWSGRHFLLDDVDFLPPGGNDGRRRGVRVVVQAQHLRCVLALYAHVSPRVGPIVYPLQPVETLRVGPVDRCTWAHTRRDIIDGRVGKFVGGIGRCRCYLLFVQLYLCALDNCNINMRPCWWHQFSFMICRCTPRSMTATCG